MPHLWASLQLSVPDNRLPQLAAWLDKKGPTIRSLTFNFQLQKGDWPALAAALQPLTWLTCLRLTDDGDREWRVSPIRLRRLALRSLRRLEVDTSGYVVVQADLLLCDSLESMHISSDCRVAYVNSPPSLARLSMPLRAERLGEVVWDCAFRASVPGLRELQLFCSWSDRAMFHFRMMMDRAPGGNIEGALLSLAELGDLAPGLEALAIDCSQASLQCEGGDRIELGLADAPQLPKGLRSLTVTQLGFSSYDFLQGLSALLHLTQLCLPKCHLHGVPRALEGLTQLEEVQLSGCISDVVGRTLAPLRALPCLRRLSLAGCDLRGLAAEELVLEGWPALQELDLAFAKVPG
ncbi:hypothetical protein N2152v2_009867 [Parachlorella kessleri]